jgi:hypothetical protein
MKQLLEIELNLLFVCPNFLTIPNLTTPCNVYKKATENNKTNE